MSCILWRGKSPVKITTNSKKTSPRFSRTVKTPNGTYENSTLHAEMNCIKFARPGDSLQVFRFHKDGTVASSLPCIYCMKAAKDAGIKYIEYMNEEGVWVKARINSANNPEGYHSPRYINDSPKKEV